MTSFPGGHVQTEVRAPVDPSRHEALVAGFEALLAGSQPEVLLRTVPLYVDDELRGSRRSGEVVSIGGHALQHRRARGAEAVPSVGPHPELTIRQVRASMEP